MNASMWILFVVQFLFMGGAFLVLPVFRRGVLFGVTVPVDFAETPEGRRLLLRYRALLASGLGLCAMSGALGVRSGHDSMYAISLLLAVALCVAHWIAAYRRTVPYRVAVPVVLRPTSGRRTQACRGCKWHPSLRSRWLRPVC